MEDAADLIHCETFGTGLSFSEDGEQVILLLMLGESEEPTHLMGWELADAHSVVHMLHELVQKGAELQEELDQCTDTAQRLALIMDFKERLSAGGN